MKTIRAYTNSEPAPALCAMNAGVSEGHKRTHILLSGEKGFLVEVRGALVVGSRAGFLFYSLPGSDTKNDRPRLPRVTVMSSSLPFRPSVRLLPSAPANIDRNDVKW